MQGNSNVHNKAFPRPTQGYSCFSQRNNYNNGQFNQNKGNLFNNQNCHYDDLYQSNLGYQHQNEMFMNNNQGFYPQTANGINNGQFVN